jgi:hypothetical protein
MPYPDAATLLTDHAAARAAGIDKVSIYSLDGLAQQPGGEVSSPSSLVRVLNDGSGCETVP